jgi:O-antigen/teichoic acid export membrane protein
MDIRAKLPSYLVGLAVLLGILAFGPPVLLFWDNKRDIRLGRVFWLMIWAGLILALLGLFSLLASHCGNGCDA